MTVTLSCWKLHKCGAPLMPGSGGRVIQTDPSSLSFEVTASAVKVTRDWFAVLLW